MTSVVGVLISIPATPREQISARSLAYRKPRANLEDQCNQLLGIIRPTAHGGPTMGGGPLPPDVVAQAFLRMPSLRSRLRRVLGCRPSMRAAPRSPSITQEVRSSTRRI